MNTINTIVWDKIVPINPIYKGMKETEKFIIENLYKILLDIGKALYGLHQKGYIHGDATIDNMGINNSGNFMLYDFDFSCRISFFGKRIGDDYRTLSRSLKLYITDKYLLESIDDILNNEDEMLSHLHIIKNR